MSFIEANIDFQVYRDNLFTATSKPDAMMEKALSQTGWQSSLHLNSDCGVEDFNKSIAFKKNVTKAEITKIAKQLKTVCFRVIPNVVFGVLSATSGVSIYIVLVQALVAEDMGAILDIFFLNLVALILGRTLRIVNLRGFLEAVVVYLLPL